jgi:hypothetical protein
MKFLPLLNIAVWSFDLALDLVDKSIGWCVIDLVVIACFMCICYKI